MVKDVLDSEGTSVSNSYLLDCCYALELIGPKEIDFKVTAEWVRNGNEHIRQAVEQFDRLGINALDSTVFFYADRDRFKFIDIEMKYYF